MKVIIKKILLMLLIGAAVYGSPEMVTFNTQEVMFHEPIEALLNASSGELLAEPSMKQATPEFAWEHGGPITREILKRFQAILTEEEYRQMHIDTKIQTFKPGEYSNTPGWHCDFFSTTDEQEDRLVRTNPGLETATRLFLLVSGEPATEFMVPRHLDLDVNVPTWRHISQYIDSIIMPSDLYQIPAATPVELTGDELHRVTVYEGEKPTVRYFMRVYLFPEGHSQYGKYRNELFEWETHQKPTITSILGDVEGFLDRAFSHLVKMDFDATPYEMTHLCYRVATEQDFFQKKGELAKVGTLISDVMADGRPYLVFKLDGPIQYHGYEVSLIALPYPKPNNTYPTALQHVAFLVKRELTALLQEYPELPFDTLELHRASHPELKLHFEDLVVKFHHLSLEDLSKKQ